MKILLAEDEQDIARTYGEALRKKGHSVVISHDGEECLLQYSAAFQAATEGDASSSIKNREIPDYDSNNNNSKARRYRFEQERIATTTAASTPFDAVILDYRMPKKDGMAVAREILGLNPRQRIIFASAFIRSTLADTIKQLNNQLVELMQKPFSMKSLVETLEDKGIYDELKKMGVNTDEIKRTNPTHHQVRDLLEGLKKLRIGSTLS